MEAKLITKIPLHMFKFKCEDTPYAWKTNKHVYTCTNEWDVMRLTSPSEDVEAKLCREGRGSKFAKHCLIHGPTGAETTRKPSS